MNEYTKPNESLTVVNPPKPTLKGKALSIADKQKLILSNAGLQSIKTAGFVLGNIFLGSPETRDSEEKLAGWDRSAVQASFLGLPTFDQFYFNKFEWTDLQGIKHAVPQVYIDSLLCEIMQSKNIITTSLQGYNGTVKEYISDGDYVVKLRGALVDASPFRYPKEQVNNLLQVCQANQAVPITSNFFFLFGIYNIVITDFNFPQITGTMNTQYFEISAISDAPIELIVK